MNPAPLRPRTSAAVWARPPTNLLAGDGAGEDKVKAAGKEGLLAGPQQDLGGRQGGQGGRVRGDDDCDGGPRRERTDWMSVRRLGI